MGSRHSRSRREAENIAEDMPGNGMEPRALKYEQTLVSERENAMTPLNVHKSYVLCPGGRASSPTHRGCYVKPPSGALYLSCPSDTSQVLVTSALATTEPDHDCVCLIGRSKAEWKCDRTSVSVRREMDSVTVYHYNTNYITSNTSMLL